MPADPEMVKKIMRDGEFQKLNPQGQLDVMHNYLSRSDEEYSALPTVGQQYHTAGQVIDAHTPGFMSQVLNYLPVVGPVKRAYEDPSSIRPFTRAAAGFMGADEAIKSPLGAATAESLREIAELVALTAVGGPVAKYVGGPIAEAVVPRLGGALMEKGLVAGAEKTMVAGAAKMGIEQLAQRAATDGTIGAMYGVVDAVERNDYNPLHMLAAPLAGAALGAGLAGLHNAMTRFGPDAAQRVLQTLHENPQINAAIAEAKPIAAKYAQAANVAPEYAGDVVSRAMSGELLDASEFNVMRRVLTSDPKFLQTDAGLRILQTQKEHLMPTVAEVPAGAEQPSQLHVRVEMPGGAVNTLIDPKPATVQKLLADNHQGRLRILEASGPGDTDFIDMARDKEAGFQAYRNSLPPAQRKGLEPTSEEQAAREFDILTAREARAGQELPPTMQPGMRGMQFTPGERLGTMRAELAADQANAAAAAEVTAAKTAALPNTLQPGIRGMTWEPRAAPTEMSPELAQKVIPHVDEMVAEQLTSSHAPELRAAVTGEAPLRPGTNPLIGTDASTTIAAPAGETGVMSVPPREPGAPIRVIGETGQATVVQDIGTHQVVQKADGTMGVTATGADGSTVELVRPSPDMAPEIAAPKAPVPPQVRPGPKPEGATTLDKAIGEMNQTGEMPIGKLTPGQIQKAMEYYDEKMMNGTITAEEEAKLAVLVKGQSGMKLTASDLQTCVRIR